MEKIYLIHLSFFAQRGPRGSRNPFFRIKNRPKVSGPAFLLKNTLSGLKKEGVNVVKNATVHFSLLS